ncbi:hypothetical protein V5799_000347 [Amblyomma americanum]|uniref:Uncharacterized protein n=1 Tax=Amblyomma americanum TaxID=6943 RepID=A0AAQ4D3A8_AMBAM
MEVFSKHLSPKLSGETSTFAASLVFEYVVFLEHFDWLAHAAYYAPLTSVSTLRPKLRIQTWRAWLQHFPSQKIGSGVKTSA